MFTENDIRNVIQVYEKKGIVTRDDFLNLDSRPLSDEVLDELQRRGYEEARITEAHLDDYMDYPRAIYNRERFEPKEADEYLIQNVLHSNKFEI